MKAVCVTADRTLEVRNLPTPGEPPAGHVLINVDSCAINPGDKAFLANPGRAGAALKGSRHDVWGASAAGVIDAVGEGLPSELVGRGVAVYRSLSRSDHTLGLWSEQAIVTRASCVLLPPTVAPGDYCGSLVNVITAYAFLEQSRAEGHRGVIVTAGNSSTGLAMAALALQRNVPALFLVRSAEAAQTLKSAGVEHVLVWNEPGVNSTLESLATELSATAVFDGVGGELTTQLIPLLPMGSCIWFYGFLGAAAPVSFSSLQLVAKDLVLRRFSNFNSPTVADPQQLAAAVDYLETVIGDPLFRTRQGEAFSLDEIRHAMAYPGLGGRKAVLRPNA